MHGGQKSGPSVKIICFENQVATQRISRGILQLTNRDNQDLSSSRLLRAANSTRQAESDWMTGDMRQGNTAMTKDITFRCG